MICQNCNQEEAVEPAVKVQHGMYLTRMALCIHCVQPVYKYVAQYAKPTPYEEINTEQKV